MFDTTSRTGRRIVLIGGLIALAVAIVVQGSQPRPAILGSNGVRPAEFVAVLSADEVLCQSDQQVPRDTGSLAMTIGTYYRAGQPVEVYLRDAEGNLLVRGRLRRGWQQGAVSLPLDRAISRDISSAQLCLTNRGTHDIAVAGSASSRGVAARIGRRIADGRISALYVSSRRQSHFVRAGRIVDAMNVPGLWGETAPWAVVVLAGLAVIAVLRTLW
ncbi:MAG TPA: hypothetical protein VGV90_06845 [Solirubrobacteraceae bacterium]|nr:hypothetical protein [Solirubrobacteraceae bacterium]